MSGHTPGPWAVDGSEQNVFEPKTRGIIAWVSSPDEMGEQNEETRANAHLIAAAPELLDLAKKFRAAVAFYVKASERDGDDEGARMKSLTLIEIDAVIAKAEGR